MVERLGEMRKERSERIEKGRKREREKRELRRQFEEEGLKEIKHFHMGK